MSRAGPSSATLAAVLWLAAPVPGGGIRWQQAFDEALKQARASQRPVLVDFWAQWCSWCRRLDETTYVDAGVVALAEGFVAVKVDTEGSPREKAVAARYGVDSLPTIAFLSPRGRMLLRLTGFQTAAQFPRTLEKARALALRVMALETALERDPNDAAALSGLGAHLFEQDSYRESAQLLRRAAQLDAERPLGERKQNRLMLGAMLKSEERFQDSEQALRSALALPPDEDADARLLYLLGRVYAAWGRREQARAALAQVVGRYARSPIAQKAREALLALGRE